MQASDTTHTTDYVSSDGQRVRHDDVMVSLEVTYETLKRLWDMVNVPPPAADSIGEREMIQIINILAERIKLAPLDGDDFLSDLELLARKKGRKVLAVDDLGIVNVQLKRTLKKNGFMADTANNIKDAMDKFTANDYDFIVMDLCLPSENDGFNLLENLVRLSKLCQLDSHIVVMTAHTKKSYEKKVLEAGAKGFIEKGPDWYNDLVEYLNEAAGE